MGNQQYRWVIVAAGGLLGCMAIGALFSLPVFLQPIARDTGWSVTGVSTAMTIGFLAMAVASMAWGTLSDRIGPAPGGADRLGAPDREPGAGQPGDVAPGVPDLFGVVAGGAAAAIMAPMMACVTGWFDTQRSLAVSLVSAGMGMAPMTMSPLAAWLISGHDWRTSLLMIAALAAAVMVPVALLVRRPPALAAAAAGAGVRGRSEPGPNSGMTLGQAVRTPQFAILMLTNFFCCATHSGPIFHTVSYAVSCGIPMIAAVTIYSVEGLAGLGGRIAFGVLGDRLGAKRVLVAGLLAQAFGALGYVFVRDLGAFYAVAALFGFIYAGVMPLYAVLARENFPLRDHGRGDRRHGNGGQPRDGARAGGRRADLRHLRQLRLALCRRLGDRARGVPDRADLPAVRPGGDAGGGAGLKCRPEAAASADALDHRGRLRHKGRNGRGGEDGMNFLVKIFTWWNGQTIGTQFFTWRKGRRVGEDSQGNIFYQNADGSKRWVIYNGEAEASRVGPEWHGWLHHTYQEPPTVAPLPRQAWEQPLPAEHDRQRAGLPPAGQHPRGRPAGAAGLRGLGSGIGYGRWRTASRRR